MWDRLVPPGALAAALATPQPGAVSTSPRVTVSPDEASGAGLPLARSPCLDHPEEQRQEGARPAWRKRRHSLAPAPRSVCVHPTWGAQAGGDEVAASAGAAEPLGEGPVGMVPAVLQPQLFCK